MVLNYIPITTNKVEMEPYLQHPFCLKAFSAFESLYPKIGYHPPWIGYFFLEKEIVVGTGGFKGKPQSNKVEIAYGTVPGFENKGIACEICKMLTVLAMWEDANLIISARTLREENASTAILRKSNYQLSGTVWDEEDGNVWEWIYQDTIPDQSI